MARASERAARFPSALEATADLLEWFGSAPPSGFDPGVWVQAQTALVEGFTNAVRHAHGPLAEPPPIEVMLRLSAGDPGGWLELRIRDRGSPFDLEAVWRELDQPQVGAGGLPERDAHWGLIMLARLRREFGWTIHYGRITPEGNELLLRSPAASPAAR